MMQNNDILQELCQTIEDLCRRDAEREQAIAHLMAQIQLEGTTVGSMSTSTNSVSGEAGPTMGMEETPMEPKASDEESTNAGRISKPNRRIVSSSYYKHGGGRRRRRRQSYPVLRKIPSTIMFNDDHSQGTATTLSTLEFHYFAHNSGANYESRLRLFDHGSGQGRQHLVMRSQMSRRRSRGEGCCKPRCPPRQITPNALIGVSDSITTLTATTKDHKHATNGSDTDEITTRGGQPSMITATKNEETDEGYLGSGADSLTAPTETAVMVTKSLFQQRHGHSNDQNGTHRGTQQNHNNGDGPDAENGGYDATTTTTTADSAGASEFKSDDNLDGPNHETPPRSGFPMTRESVTVVSDVAIVEGNARIAREKQKSPSDGFIEQKQHRPLPKRQQSLVSQSDSMKVQVHSNQQHKNKSNNNSNMKTMAAGVESNKNVPPPPLAAPLNPRNQLESAGTTGRKSVRLGASPPDAADPDQVSVDIYDDDDDDDDNKWPSPHNDVPEPSPVELSRKTTRHVSSGIQPLGTDLRQMTPGFRSSDTWKILRREFQILGMHREEDEEEADDDSEEEEEVVLIDDDDETVSIILEAIQEFRSHQAGSDVDDYDDHDNGEEKAMPTISETAQLRTTTKMKMTPSIAMSIWSSSSAAAVVNGTPAAPAAVASDNEEDEDSGVVPDDDSSGMSMPSSSDASSVVQQIQQPHRVSAPALKEQMRYDSAGSLYVEDTTRVASGRRQQHRLHLKTPRFSSVSSTASGYLVHRQIVIDADGMAGTYTGTISHRTNKPHGMGVMQYHQGSQTDKENGPPLSLLSMKYQGMWEEGYWHGRGKLHYPNGNVYDGDFVKHSCQGKGTLRYRPDHPSKKKIYVGDFIHDRPHGEGMLVYGNSKSDSGDERTSRYEGAFFQGKCQGHGVANFADGSVYEGEWRNNMYWGYGRCRWADGRVYEGDFVQNQSHGYGFETYPDGSVRHQGEWKHNKPVRK